MCYLNYPAFPASVGHHPDKAVQQFRQVCGTVLPFYYMAGEANHDMFILCINILKWNHHRWQHKGDPFTLL